MNDKNNERNNKYRGLLSILSEAIFDSYIYVGAVVLIIFADRGFDFVFFLLFI